MVLTSSPSIPQKIVSEGEWDIRIEALVRSRGLDKLHFYRRVVRSGFYTDPDTDMKIERLVLETVCRDEVIAFFREIDGLIVILDDSKLSELETRIREKEQGELS